MWYHNDIAFSAAPQVALQNFTNKLDSRSSQLPRIPLFIGFMYFAGVVLKYNKPYIGFTST